MLASLAAAVIASASGAGAGVKPGAPTAAAVAAERPFAPSSATTTATAAGTTPPSFTSTSPPSAEATGATPSWWVPAAHAGGVLVGMRLAVSLAWPEAYDPTRLAEMRRQLRIAYTRPPELRRGRDLLESDGDPWWVNGPGHALFGSEIYGRARQCGRGAGAALGAAALASVAWEYGLEAPHKRPSAVDLVWTPLAGAALGEGRFRLHGWLRRRGAAPWLLFVVDPLGEAERRLFRTGC